MTVQWVVETRWLNGTHCPKCGPLDVQGPPVRKSQPYRRLDCRRDFSIRTGRLTQGADLGLQVFVLAILLVNASLGTSQV